ncbi:MAG: hypothetical protein LBN07_01000 [Christensenellaceae bacterium]|jgi:rubrerythrin|nr:hypothetical protein [Christensenellaceae bacterium]
MTIEQMASEIAKNNKSEQEAIEGYYLLIDEAKRNNAPKEFIAQVEEIISDEMNHSEVLSYWVTKMTGIKPNET